MMMVEDLWRETKRDEKEWLTETELMRHVC